MKSGVHFCNAAESEKEQAEGRDTTRPYEEFNMKIEYNPKKATPAFNEAFGKFSDSFAEACAEYARYVKEKVDKSNAEAKLIGPEDSTQMLMQEMRTVNMLAVTLIRIETFKTRKLFECDTKL